MIRYIEVLHRPMPAPRPRVTRRGTYMKKEYVEYKNYIKEKYLEKYKNDRSKKPISMVAEFVFKAPKSWSKKKRENTKLHTTRPDIDNLVKAVKDSLNGVAYCDDSQICDIYATKKYGDEDRICIYIEEIEEEE